MKGDLVIVETKNTPRVTADFEKAYLRIEGNSYPENANDFYNQLQSWVTKLRIKKDHLTIETQFHYIASSSVIAFLKFLKRAESLFDPCKFKLTWEYDYDDDDVMQIGEDLQTLFPFEFNLKEIK